jgi:hypothetical protein
MKAEQSGAVYKITLGRDVLKLNEMGATINARMGLTTWAAFYATNEDAAVAGDVAMRESEVTPTLKGAALRRTLCSRHSSAHDHTQPTNIFFH